MTYQEALAFIEQLKSGKKYFGLLQEANRGLLFESVDCFKYWNTVEGDPQKSQQKTLSEEELIALLEKQDYQQMLLGLVSIHI